LQEVGLPDLIEFRSTWEQAYPSSLTRRKVQERLRAFFKYGLNAGFIPKNPAAMKPSIKVQQSPALALEPDQYLPMLPRNCWPAPTGTPGTFSGGRGTFSQTPRLKSGIRICTRFTFVIMSRSWRARKVAADSSR
jgi:hypothetical protein